MTRRRAAALALACAAALTLGGCAVEGTVTIESAQRVAVDVTVRNPDTASCDGYAEAVGWGLVVTPVEGDTGPRCRFVGSVDPAKLGLANVLLIDGGEHLFFGLYPIGPGATLGSRSMHSVLDLDLRFVFPGPVLRSSGTMSGNEAGFTREQLLEGGLTAVGQGHPGPPWWLLALGGGLAGGTGIGAAIARAVWRRGPDTTDEAPEAGDGDVPADPSEASVDAPVAPPAAVDDSVWAPPDR